MNLCYIGYFFRSEIPLYNLKDVIIMSYILISHWFRFSKVACCFCLSYHRHLVAGIFLWMLFSLIPLASLWARKWRFSSVLCTLLTHHIIYFWLFLSIGHSLLHIFDIDRLWLHFCTLIMEHLLRGQVMGRLLFWLATMELNLPLMIDRLNCCMVLHLLSSKYLRCEDYF